MVRNGQGRIKQRCEALTWQGIADAVPVLLEEGGVEEVLKFLAYLAHGEVIPAPVVARLQEQAARVAGKCG